MADDITCIGEVIQSLIKIISKCLYLGGFTRLNKGLQLHSISKLSALAASNLEASFLLAVQLSFYLQVAAKTAISKLSTTFKIGYQYISLCILLVASLQTNIAHSFQTQGTPSHTNKESTSTAKPLLNINDYVHLQWRNFNNQQFPSIFDLAQDPQGFIWLATYDGLIRFDGVNFIKVLAEQNQEQQQGIVSQYVSNIEISRDGSIWFVPFNSGLARLKGGQLELFNINHGLLCDTVTELTIDKHDKLWYACDDGIGYYQDGRFFQHSNHDGSEITALMIESEKSIWYGNIDGDVYHLFEGQKTIWNEQDGIGNSNIHTIFRQNDQQILIGTRANGVYVLKRSTTPNDVDPKAKVTQPEVFNDIKDMSIEDIIADKFDILWFGTNKGMARYHPETGKLEIKLLGNEAIEGARGKALLSDQQGNIWAGFYAKGLHQMIYPKINVISSFDNIFYAVRCVAEYDNSYWIGTDNAGITIKSHQGGTKQLNIDDGLPSNTIHTLFADRQDNLWIGSSKGIVKYRDGKLSHYDLASLGISTWITAITESDDGKIWIGTINGIAYIENEQVKLASTDDPRSRSRIRWIAQTQDKTMWVGTYDSVMYLQDEQWQLPSHPELNSKSHRSFHQDAEGGMWFGSLVGEGLTWLTPNGQIRSFTTEDGLFDNYMWTIAEDSLGYLWMISDKGISRVKRELLENYHDSEGNVKSKQKILSTTLGRYEGLEVTECNGSSPGYAHTEAGKIIFPCMVGLVEIDPLNIQMPNKAPHSIIDYVSTQSASHWQPASLTLAPEQRDFTVGFTAIGYDNPDKIEFRYRLIGYKQQWQTLGPKRNVSFTNLSAGEYQFELSAKFYNGQWNQKPRTLTIIIQPYFHETWWFPSLWLAISIILGYIWFKRRVNTAIENTKALNNAKIEYLGALVGSVASNLNDPVDRALKDAATLPSHIETLDIEKLNRLSRSVYGDLQKITQVVELFKQLNIDNYANDIQVLDVAHLINTIKIDTEINHPERQIKWTIVQNAGPSINSYPHVIEQIIAVFIDNTLIHGYPIITKKQKAEGQQDEKQVAEIFLKFEIKRRQLLIQYMDKGKGIDEAYHENLFLPFNPASGNAGLGLGMNLVHNLVTYKLQGQIEFTPNSPNGVNFLISIPI